MKTVREMLNTGGAQAVESFLKDVSLGDVLEGRIARARLLSGLTSAAMQVHVDAAGDPQAASLKKVTDAAGTTPISVTSVAVFTGTINVAAAGLYEYTARVLEDDGTINEYPFDFLRAGAETTAQIRDALVTDGLAELPNTLTIAADAGSTFTVTGDPGVVFELLVSPTPNPGDATVATTGPGAGECVLGYSADGVPRLLFPAAVTGYGVLEQVLPDNLFEALAREP